MLTKLATFVTENPIIILFGFFSSIIGTVEIIYSVIKSKKNKKKELELEEKTSKIYSYLNEKAEFSETSDDLIKAKEELERLRKQIEVELPEERRVAVIKEQIKYEEQLIKDANIRLEKLRNDIISEDDVSFSKLQRIFHKIRHFITSENTRELITLLVFLGTTLYFISITVGAVATKVLGIASIAVIPFYIKNNYNFLKTEKGEKLITVIINIALSLCFIDSMIDGNIRGLIWWFILILISSFCLKITNICIDLLLPLLSVPLFISIFFFSSYEFPIIISIVIVQMLLIIINIKRLFNVFKTKVDGKQ